MKENKITRTIEEVKGYIADDGTWFLGKEECLKYEESAKMVLYNKIKDKILVKTTEYELYDVGCDDLEIDIIKVDSPETAELLNRYINICLYDKSVGNLITEDMIGENILLCWNFDGDYCWVFKSIYKLLASINHNYEKMIASVEVKKQGE